MIRNPFTPVFGGKPNVFFGRREILRRFDEALFNPGSDYRALFVTGTRGYGKTALLEQFSRRAEAGGWRTIDVGPRNPIGNIMRGLVSYDEATKTIDPELEVSIFGTGGKVRGGSSSKTVRYGNDDFEYVFVKSCAAKGFKLFVSIDEIQKVSLEDVSAISNAFQMASRKGFDVMLAVAGLPQSHDKIIRQKGCTFMRRASHVTLGPLRADEVRAAFEETFANVDGVSLTDGALSKLVAKSFGHPYVMQLQGYYTLELVVGQGASGEVKISEEDVDAAMATVVEVYAERAARPLVDELTGAERAYLTAMLEVMGPERVAKTRDVALRLGKEQSQLSQVRDRLLGSNIVFAPRRGELVFAVPYLDGCLKSAAADYNGLEAVSQWRM